MIILNLFYLIMPLTIILAFMWAPPAEILGEASRIIYFHVPLAWVSALAFFISGILSVIYLWDKEKKYRLLELKANNSARIGLIFTSLTIITGSIWSKISWGAYWNWDPRQTSVMLLLLIYLAYFSLRAALSGNPSTGKLTSSYLIIAMMSVPFLIFVVPRVYVSLHPDPIINMNINISLDEKMKVTLLVSVVSFTLLFFYLFSIANKIEKIRSGIEEEYGENTQ